MTLTKPYSLICCLAVPVRLIFFAGAFLAASAFLPAEFKSEMKSYPLTSLESLKLHKVTAEPAKYRDRNALRVTEPSGGSAGEDRLIIVPDSGFQNGVIEVDLAGKLAPGAGEQARGFIGVAFRVAADVSKFECIYLRPTNGRAEDQVRRNHSVQYISFPEYPWQRLRKEEPEKYETYVDLEPGEWTKVKIEVQGPKARLYVNGGGQPTLVVNDLKLPEFKGSIALWIGPGTEGYFSNLRITR